MDRIISLLAALVGLIALGGAILVHTNGDAQRNEMASQIAQLKVSVDLLGRQTGAASPSPPPAQASIPSAEPPISEYVAAETPSSSSSAAPPPPSSASSSVPPPLVVPLTPPPASSSAASELPPAAPSSAAAEDDPRLAEVKALQDRISSLEQVMQDQAAQLEAAKAAQTAAPASASASSISSGPDVADIGASSAAPAGTPAAVVAGGPTTDCIPIGTRFMASSGDNFPICKTKVVVKVAAVSDGFATISGAGDVAAGTTGDLVKGCSVMVFSADSTGYAEMRVSCQ